MNYTVYHCHTDKGSFCDSATTAEEYINKAVELGQNAICFTEHGMIFSWYEKYEACEKAGIKYMHGCEVYLTERYTPKVRDNYHTVLIAKNMDGFRELNSLVDSASHPDHQYYKPRISFEDFLNISDNIIKISACLASPLNKARDSEYYEDLCKKYDYYEVQAHDSDDQREYNEHLVELAARYGKPLIAGTDTHSLNAYKAECRDILQKGKNITFSDEDVFDLTYKTYDELYSMFKGQGVLNDTEILEAIGNTNVMASMCEPITVDRSVKYPKTYDDEEAVFKKRIQKMYADKCRRGVMTPSLEIKKRVQEELRVFKKINMIGFMLFMSELICWCKENGIPVGPGRGSVTGSLVAYITGITDVDSVKWNTTFSRFCNEDRRELGDSFKSPGCYA